MNIVNTELLTILFHVEKRRLYFTLKNFWPKGLEKRKLSLLVVQQLHEKIPQHITLLLNLSQLKIMQPQIAEEVFCGLKSFMNVKHVRAIATVENPENALAKLQFQRIIAQLETPEDYPISAFTNKYDAEAWLDQVAR